MNRSKYQIALQVLALVSTTFAAGTVKLQDFQVGTKNAAEAPGSRVTITVGEKNGFSYKVDGSTLSDKRIAVSGKYFNDELNNNGFADLFLVVDSGIAYFNVRSFGYRLDIYVENFVYDNFSFQVYTPQPVTAYDLQYGQINETAILVSGPSRSMVFPSKRG